MQFFVSHFVYKLWKSAFGEKDKETTVNTVRSNGVTGKKFHDAVVEKFLTQYDGMKGIEVPDGYHFQNRQGLCKNMRRTELVGIRIFVIYLELVQVRRYQLY
jgi:hypothetical protein